MEITRELLEVEPEDVTELLQSHDKTLKDEKLLLKNEKRKGFLKVVTTPDKDAIEFVEMTTKDFKYYINLVDKAAAGFERIDSDFQRSSTVGKWHQTVLRTTEKSFVKRIISQYSKPHCYPILRNCRSHPKLLQQPL